MKLSIIKNHAQAIGNNKFYSVIMPLINIKGNWNVLFEIRAKSMKVQPGEICFPGGRVETGENPLIAGIRECVEELGINEEKIEIITESDYYNKGQSEIRCYIAKLHIDSLDELKINSDEVDSVFLVPLEYLLDYIPEIYSLDTKYSFPDNFPYDLIPSGKRYDWRDVQHDIYFYVYEDKVIWGLTGRLLYHALERIIIN